MTDILNFINGEFVPSVSGDFLDNYEPATGQVYSRVASSTAGDVDAAVAAAASAFPVWSHTPAVDRSTIMMRWAELLESRLEEFAEAESRDNGKPYELAKRIDIPRAIANLRFFGTAILHEQTEAQVMDRVALNYTLRRPLGVVGLISPWNLPLYLFTWKIAPAIAVGNTAVGKPSELTPRTASMLCELAVEAGLPPGVLNVVHGTGAEAGPALTTHPDVKAVSFTGGTVTGATITKATAGSFKKLSLEMGGKNASIVFADAEKQASLDGCVRGAFTNQGEICLCGSRILVERSVYDSFVDRFVQRVRGLKIGDPLQPEVDQGALVSAAHLEKVAGFVERARAGGAEVRCGGSRPDQLPERCRDGYFYLPTVITGQDETCEINQEEVFGPVVTIIPFDDEDDAVRIANSTRYGLAASVWTSDVNRAHRVADSLESGIVWVNCWMLRDLRVPFGGVKDSGVGREGGIDALRFFTEPKNVCLKISDI